MADFGIQAISITRYGVTISATHGDDFEHEPHMVGAVLRHVFNSNQQLLLFVMESLADCYDTDGLVDMDGLLDDDSKEFTNALATLAGRYRDRMRR